ncbi:hypothetical protein IW492_08890 [Enterococcus sp. BWB1-3]|uniref:hypothetical protein n=1 Tax=Enterococcus sp. BWB1-3 TaxID=2787713 RepID=UPI00192132BA|nr:hypothetical protein [Enterococcus sp. BWB1-3]MBL1229345.1 hypothetical protein [Enterococcus sp. BWB1-3]
MKFVLKNKKKIGVIAIIIFAVLAIFGSCNKKGFAGYYNGTDEKGNNYSIEITKDKLKLLQGNQLTEHDYKVEDIRTDEGKYINTALYVTEQDTTGTFISFGEAKEEKGVYAMVISRDGANTLNLATMHKVDKKSSPIVEQEKGVLSFLKVCIFALIGVGVIAYVQHKKQLRGTYNDKEGSA